MHTEHLPRLPFGNHGAISDSLIESLRDTLAIAVPGEFEMSVSTPDRKFRHKTNVVRVGEMLLAATSVTPIAVRRFEVPYATLRIPTSGYCTYKLGGSRCVEQTGRSAVLLSGAPRSAETGGAYTCVQVVLDKGRLFETAAAMRGEKEATASESLSLNRDRELGLQLGTISFDAIIRSHFALVDSLESQPHAMAMMCLDDFLYRSFAMILEPALLGYTDCDHKRSAVDGVRMLDTVCGYIQAHLADPITLTRLEQLSGFSRRSLQYAFMRRFGLTPMQWLREQRLTLARTHLSNADCRTTVIRVALSCGFAGAGTFSRHYLGRFGESPSATLARALAK